MSSYVVCKTNVSGRQHALECDVCWQWTTFFCAGSNGYTFLVLVRGRTFQGTKVPGSESSTYGTFALGNESSIIRCLTANFITIISVKNPRSYRVVIDKLHQRSYLPISVVWYFIQLFPLTAAVSRMYYGFNAVGMMLSSRCWGDNSVIVISRSNGPTNQCL